MKIKKFFIIPILLLIVTGVYVLINLLPKNVEASSDSSSTSDLQLMARAINGEARGEPYEGQVAVGAVILNRVKSSQFPNTIAGVIYEKGAFTAVSDGQINVPIKEGSTVLKAARDAMNGWDPTGGAIYYFNTVKTVRHISRLNTFPRCVLSRAWMSGVPAIRLRPLWLGRVPSSAETALPA